MNSEEHRGVRRQNSHLHGKGPARGQSQYQLDQSEYRVRSRISQLSRRHSRSLRRAKLFLDEFALVPGQDCQSGNFQLTFADSAEDHISWSAGFLSGNGGLELQPRRPGQSPPGGLRSAANAARPTSDRGVGESSGPGRSPGGRAHRRQSQALCHPLPPCAFAGNIARYLPREAICRCAFEERRHKHVVAFARSFRETTVLVLAGRFFAQLDAQTRLPVGAEAWGNTEIVLRKQLPAGAYRDVFTGQTVSPVRTERRFRPVRSPKHFRICRSPCWSMLRDRQARCRIT